MNFKFNKVNLIAKKCDFVPRNEIEVAYAEMFSHQFTDVFNLANAAFMNANSTNQTNILTVLNATLSLTLKRVEERIIANPLGCGVIAGRDISYADIYLSAILDLVGNQRDNVTMPYPNVKALDARVRSMPKIAEWIKNRPVTVY